MTIERGGPDDPLVWALWQAGPPLAWLRLDPPRVIRVNPAWAALFQVAPEALAGREIAELLPGDDPAALRRLLEGGGAGDLVSHGPVALGGPSTPIDGWLWLWRTDPSRGADRAPQAVALFHPGEPSWPPRTQLLEIVHDLRNPLAGAASALQILAGRAPADGEERAIFDEIQQRLQQVQRGLDRLVSD